MRNCTNGQLTFELITGYVFTSPSETMTMIPGTLQLTDCIAHCRRNDTCHAINFETGLCVILSASALQTPDALTPSQFPVFTIYAQKVCIPGISQICDRPWSFERVVGYKLRKFERKTIGNVSSREACMAECLKESEFQCRSANYDNSSDECVLSDVNRHNIAANGNSGLLQADKYFAPSSSQTTDYLENNCIEEPKKMCDFTVIKGRILKTVDSVFQDINTVEGCKEKCLTSPYRCFSFDFGDPSNSVCRTSHLDRASLTHIENPYLSINDAVTYELASCYNVSIFCRAREMVASVQTNKLFNGKIYAKTKPNSCVNDVNNSLNFDISMPYNDLLCDVKQRDQGKFSSDIIIQHHDMVVTTKDLGLSVNCNYDLSNKSVTNKQSFSVEGGLDAREEENIHSHTVNAPNITMKITDMEGNDIKSAQVGDRLILRVEILEKNSPYEIFVRELLAVDGVDSADIVLIDPPGCPTDISIMSFAEKDDKDGKSIEIPFNAFKFPTSDIVQFKAMVTPCIQSCEPVNCIVQGTDGKAQETPSYGRRRRRRSTANTTKKDGVFDEEVVVLQSIKILDSFDFQGKQKAERKDDYFVLNDNSSRPMTTFSNQCINMAGLTVFCVIFLLIQLILVFIWAMQWHRRNKHMLKAQKSLKMLSKMSYPPTMSGVSIGSCHRYSNFMKQQNE